MALLNHHYWIHKFSSQLFCSNLVKLNFNLSNGSIITRQLSSQFFMLINLKNSRHFSRSSIKLSSANETLYHNISQPFEVPTESETHLIQSDLTYESLISHQEIRQRQRNLIELTGEWLRKVSPPKNVPQQITPLILIASSPQQFQANTNIPINDGKQNSEFTYFTGLHSGSSDQITSDCVLAIFLEDAHCLDSIYSVIFSPTRTKSDRLWNGPELSLQYKDWLKEICDDVQPLSELASFLNKHIKSNRRDLFLSRKGLQYRPELVTHLKYYLKHPSSFGDNNDLEKWSTSLSQTIQSVNVRDASTFIDQLRLIKSYSESEALKRVCKIGARSLSNTIHWSRRMLNHPSFTFLESHIAAKFAFESKISGARKLSFPSICASGPRSTIIHYGRNDHLITSGEDECWVLTDVGCEDVDGYCCDISRTWPINLNQINNNKFQIRLQLYEALIGVQHELINSIEIGKTSLDDLNKMMLDMLAKILLNFNLFEGSVSKSDVQSIIKRLCAHHVSHYIGLDIHDTPSISRSMPLVPGMCFSIEPGLYFPNEGLPIKSEFRNIGLRIEDDILIEPQTNVIINLTSDCPKITI